MSLGAGSGTVQAPPGDGSVSDTAVTESGRAAPEEGVAAARALSSSSVRKKSSGMSWLA